MKIEDINCTWDMKPLLKEGDLIECPECKEWINHNEWIESSVDCELCGDHTAIQCPKCDELFDHVYSPEFNTKTSV